VLIEAIREESVSPHASASRGPVAPGAASFAAKSALLRRSREGG
jgi:hypothetical protein